MKSLNAFSPMSGEDLLRILDGVPTPCLVLDCSFRIVTANKAYLSVTATRRRDIEGRQFFDIFPDNPASTGAANLRESLERVAATGQPDTMPVQRYDLCRPPRRKGQFERRYWSMVNTPVLDKRGRRTAYIVHRVVDVTDFLGLSDQMHQVGGGCEELRARLEVLEIEMFERSKELHATNQQLHTAIQRLRDSEETLRLSQAIGRMGTFDWDITSDSVKWASEIAQLYGFPAKPFSSNFDKWRSSIHRDDRATLSDRIAEALDTGNFEAEWRVVWPDDSVHWLAGRAAIYSNESDMPTRMLGVNIDITDRKRSEENLRRAALHDPLTGLPNRALLIEYGSRLLAAAKRSHERGALLFIDLDRFKPINDQYGHEIGDRVLQQVAVRLMECTRHEDVVSRMGGDEFVLMLAHLGGGLNRASAVAQHVLNSLSTPFEINGHELLTSPSIGIANYPEHGDTVDALIHASDLAMYRVKESGRADYQFYTPDLDERAEEVYLLEKRLRGALRHNRLALHYQPIVDATTGKLMGAEALVRLDDAGDASGPSKFIPIAEAAGLIGELGEWVAKEACRQHGEWRSQGMPVAVSINVSPLQFRQRTFPDRLGKLISDAGIDPEFLHLELTESALMQNVDEAVQTLNRLKSLGVKVAIDDFGTGYSSLSRLSCLPLDKLKVDQSFVHGIGANSASRAVTDTIIALARSLKLDVIGEGVESKDELTYLEEHGCQQVQGFLFSEPLTASEFARRYREPAGSRQGADTR